MNFSHKKQKNNPPLISYTFFHGKELKVKSFEESNLSSSIYNYFSIFDIIKSQYRYKIYIDKMDDYTLSIKIEYKQKEYLLNQSLSSLNKMEVLKFLSFLNNHLPETTMLLDKDFVTLSKNKLEQFLLNTSTKYQLKKNPKRGIEIAEKEIWQLNI
jgi:hypothetical protein